MFAADYMTKVLMRLLTLHSVSKTNLINNVCHKTTVTIGNAFSRIIVFFFFFVLLRRGGNFLSISHFTSTS